MPIIIEEVLGGAAGAWRVRAKYGERSIVAEVKMDSARAAVGRLLPVEIAILRVLAWQKSDEPSGIYTLPSGQNRLVGEIEGDMPLDDGSFLYDLYLSPGPDYFAIDSTDIGGARLLPGQRIAVDVEGLCFHPTRV